MRLVVVLLVLLASGCGRISPGVINRPWESNSIPSGPASKSTEGDVYDDKGCVNGTDASSRDRQAACRRAR
ncbi:MAG: hypothetical protein IAE78_10110 [Myxococcus sp.]|nr:hypothetical protein [Myxococcus sp.]